MKNCVFSSFCICSFGICCKIYKKNVDHVYDTDSAESVASTMQKYDLGAIPVVNKNKKLIGIVTNRDLRFEKNEERPVIEVMTSENLITTLESIELSKAEVILQENRIEKLPKIDKNSPKLQQKPPKSIFTIANQLVRISCCIFGLLLLILSHFLILVALNF